MIAGYDYPDLIPGADETALRFVEWGERERRPVAVDLNDADLFDLWVSAPTALTFREWAGNAFGYGHRPPCPHRALER